MKGISAKASTARCVNH